MVTSQYMESMTSAATPQGVNNLSEFNSPGKRWRAELETAKNWRKKFITVAERTVRRYLDERDAINTGDRRFNILWSNVQTLTPAVYTHPPKPETDRRFDTTDQIARVASIIMERNLDYLVCEHSLYDGVMKAVVQDRLIPGQGTAWVRYEANLPAVADVVTPPGQGPAPKAMNDGQMKPVNENQPLYTVTDDTYAIPTGEKVCFDYVHWKDFVCSPARTWEEVTWVARKVYLTQAQGVERFGEEFKQVPLNYKPATQQKAGNKEFGPGQSVVNKAVVYEIWDKTTRKVYWLADDYDTILDEKDDIFKLTDFFPCPKPLLATTTTDSILPIPDFMMYQDQAFELDQLTNRISLLTQAVKIVGVYDKSQVGVQRMLTEGVDNTLIPVDNWAMFAERGGLKGTLDFYPVEMVMNVLTALVQARGVVKQDVYEITGLADIVRGASVASETATAQNIKAKFANIRIGDVQRDVARFASDLVNMAAQLITNFFQPETLILNADLDPATSPDAQFIPGAIALIKNGGLVKHKIMVSVDAITDPDAEEEKKARVEFLQAMGMFMQQAQPVVEKTPQLAPMMGQMIMFGVRGFKAGRDLEGVIQQGLAQLANAPPPEKPKDPAQQKAEAEMEMDKQRGMLELEKAKREDERESQKNMQELALEREKNAMELEQMREENALKLEFMRREFELKYDIAKMEAGLKQETAAQDAAIKQEAHVVDSTIKQESHMQDAAIQQEQHEQAGEHADAKQDREIAQQEIQFAERKEEAEDD
jgi:hypothetical protein